MAFKIKDNPHLFHKAKEEPSYDAEEIQKKAKTKGSVNITPEVLNIANAWSQEQQKAFENALTKFPKKTVGDRWEKISKSVPGKTKVNIG